MTEQGLSAMAMESSPQEIPTLSKTMSEAELLGIKLREEITHLEKWMDSQLNNDRISSNSIVNTIKGLIETRQSLLKTLQNPTQSKQVDNGIQTERPETELDS